MHIDLEPRTYPPGHVRSLQTLQRPVRQTLQHDGRIPPHGERTHIPVPRGPLPSTYMVKQFFPQDQLHVVSSKGTKQAKPSMQDTGSRPSPHTQGPDPAIKTANPYSQIAKLVVETTQVGTFKSTNCRDTIRTNCPKHQLANASTSHFGNEFKNNVWPILEQWGVRISNPGKHPVRYKMTAKAKTRYSQTPLVQTV